MVSNRKFTTRRAKGREDASNSQAVSSHPTPVDEKQCLHSLAALEEAKRKAEQQQKRELAHRQAEKRKVDRTASPIPIAIEITERLRKAALDRDGLQGPSKRLRVEEDLTTPTSGYALLPWEGKRDEGSASGSLINNTLSLLHDFCREHRGKSVVPSRAVFNDVAKGDANATVELLARLGLTQLEDNPLPLDRHSMEGTYDIFLQLAYLNRLVANEAMVKVRYAEIVSHHREKHAELQGLFDEMKSACADALRKFEELSKETAQLRAQNEQLIKEKASDLESYKADLDRLVDDLRWERAEKQRELQNKEKETLLNFCQSSVLDDLASLYAGDSISEAVETTKSQVAFLLNLDRDGEVLSKVDPYTMGPDMLPLDEDASEGLPAADPYDYLRETMIEAVTARLDAEKAKADEAKAQKEAARKGKDIAAEQLHDNPIPLQVLLPIELSPEKPEGAIEKRTKEG